MVGQKSTKAQSVFFHIFSCVLGFIMVYPLLWLLMSSFKSNDTMFHNAWSLIPEKWDILTNYLSGWKGIAGIPFWRFTLNSVIVTVVSVAGTIFCSLLAAYAVSRLKFKGANFWFGCIVMTMMIPSQVMVVPQYIILKKLGLSDKIIEKARQQISSEQESFEDVLSSLETRRVQLERERADFDEQKKKLENRLADLTRREEKLQSQKDDILRNANEQARDILRDAKKVADETIRSFQKFDDNSSMKEMEQKRTKVREKISEKDSKLTLKAPKAPKGSKVKATELHLGDRVKVLSMNLRGTVSSKPDAKGYLFVQCGIIRSKVHISDLVLIPEDDITASTISHSSYGKITMAKSANVRTEINLLGKTVDEALNALDKYLDDAYMAHIPSVRIVHGKGTGALRNAVQTHLRALPYVASFRLGEYGEGDAGVTIATFK